MLAKNRGHRAPTAPASGPNEEATAAAQIVHRWIPIDVVADNKQRERMRQVTRVVATVLLLTLVGSLLVGAVSLL